MFPFLWFLGPAGAITGLLAAGFLYRQMKREPEENEALRAVAESRRATARAYLIKQTRMTVSVLSATFVLLLVLHFLGLQDAAVAPAFLVGGMSSAMMVSLGLLVAVQASGRTLRAATVEGADAALSVAFRSGAVIGLTVTGTALLFVVLAFYLVSFLLPSTPLRESAVLLVSFALGTSLQALLARVSGGLFSKTADVMADLVAKLEPASASGHPAMTARDVGENMSDVAGLGADLLGSYSSSILAAMALGVTAMTAISPTDTAAQSKAAALPIAIAGLGVLASLPALLRARDGKEGTRQALTRALDRSAQTTALALALGSAVVCHFLFRGLLLPNSLGWTGLWGCVMLGQGAGLAISKANERPASPEPSPLTLKSVAGQPGTTSVLIEGSTTGAKNSLPVLAVVLCVLASFLLCGGLDQFPLGLFGVSLASLGMLSTLAVTLATGVFGQVANSAHRTAQGAALPPEVVQKIEPLASVGRASAIATKRFATGSAALTCLALLGAYGEQLKLCLVRLSMEQGELSVWGHSKIDELAARGASYSDLATWYQATVLNPLALSGLLVGAALPFAFSALMIRAAERSLAVTLEKGPQHEPESAETLDGTRESAHLAYLVVTASNAHSQMVTPTLLAIMAPLTVGIVLGPAGVMGMLTGGVATGLPLALTTVGDRFSARTELETTDLACERTAPALVMADSFRDTAGPAFNVLAKLIAVCAVVFAGLTVKLAPLFAHAVGFF